MTPGSSRAASGGFPVEVRFAAADDLWLSTAHGRATAYVAVHQYLRRRPDAVLRRRRADRRPGGWPAALGQDALARGRAARSLYPRFADAQRARRRTPTGVFSNPYLDRLLGG